MKRSTSAVVSRVLLVALFAAACSGADDDSTATTPTPSVRTSAPAVTGPGGQWSTPVELVSEPVFDPVGAPPWEPATRTEQVAGEIATGDIPIAQLAVDALAVSGVDIPGATPSDLPPGDGFDPTYALGLARAAIDELDTAQRAIVDDLVSDGELVATIDGDTVRFAEPPTDSIAPSGWRQTAPHPDTAALNEQVAELAAVKSKWRAHRPELPHPSVNVYVSRRQVKNWAMTAQTPDPQVPGTCKVTIYPLGAWASRADRAQLLAHEYFHCIQQTWVPALVAPAWVVEGGASFAAIDLLGGTPSRTFLFTNWFVDQNGNGGPTMPLENRNYDAWPLYLTAAQLGIDPYVALEALVTAGATGSVAASLAAGGLDSFEFADAWSTKSARPSRTRVNGRWRFDWPGSSDGGPRDTSFRLTPMGRGVRQVHGPEMFAHHTLALPFERGVGVVAVQPFGGSVTTLLADGTSSAVPEGTVERFCVAPEDCACPAGTTSDAPVVEPPLLLAFPVRQAPTSATVRATEWNPDLECRPDGSLRLSGSRGDPHIVTFDGRPYTVQALGEFVLARDAGSDFEVQARHQPFGAAAANSAIAVRSGGRRITFTADGFDGGFPVIRIDGTEVPLGELAGARVGDAEVHAVDADWQVVTADGRRVTVRWRRGWWVNVGVPVDGVWEMSGLLGSPDGVADNDLRTPDGQPFTGGEAAIDTEFAPTWAVDDDTTLFDYEPGEGPETFRLPLPPAPAIDATARDRCATALGEQATSHEVDHCAFDMSATGDDAFLDAYAEVVDARVATLPPAVSTTSSGPAGPRSTSPTGAAGEPGEVQTVGDAAVVVGGPDHPAEGLLVLERGTVVVARTAPAACDVAPALEVVITLADGAADRGLGGRVASGLCNRLDLDQRHPGEAYLFVIESGTYRIAAGDGLQPAAHAVEVFADPTPTVLTTTDLDSGWAGRIDGIADTIVLALVDPAARHWQITAEGACVSGVWGPEFAVDLTSTYAAWALDDRCPVPGDVSNVLFVGALVPYVLFARDGPVDVTIEPS